MAHGLHTFTHLPTLEQRLRAGGVDWLLAALDDALARRVIWLDAELLRAPPETLFHLVGAPASPPLNGPAASFTPPGGRAGEQATGPAGRLLHPRQESPL